MSPRANRSIRSNRSNGSNNILKALNVLNTLNLLNSSPLTRQHFRQTVDAGVEVDVFGSVLAQIAPNARHELDGAVHVGILALHIRADLDEIFGVAVGR